MLAKFFQGSVLAARPMKAPAVGGKKARKATTTVGERAAFLAGVVAEVLLPRLLAAGP